MEGLRHIIRQIATEINAYGNTRERVARAFTRIADLLGGKVDKETGKGLSANDFTNDHKAKLDGIDLSVKLDKGTYTGNAKDLEVAIDRKVDKVPNKGLSANDYTDEDKNTLLNTAKKVVKALTITGDVNKIATLTLEDGTTLQASFKDLGEQNIADVMLNSLNFNTQTGVLTGVRSDGQQLTVDLDGRFALLDHNHDEAYAPKTHTHSEFALRTHIHNWDDIDRKPTNLATTEHVATEIGKIKVGGRNLIRNSHVQINGVFFRPELTKELKEGQTYTFSAEAKGGLVGQIFFNNATRGYFPAGVYSDFVKIATTFTFVRNDYQGAIIFPHVYGAEAVRNYKLEEGNQATSYTPAPEDIYDEIHSLKNGFKITGNHALTDMQCNKVIYVTAPCTIDLGGVSNLLQVSFIKCFNGGVVGFSANRKTVKYINGDALNGGDGSTCTASVLDNAIYIHLNNI